jgi:hypothetical protein
MDLKYDIHVLGGRRVNWVQLNSPDTDTDPFAGLREEHMVEIDRWVVEHQLGVRKSFNQWRLKDSTAVLVFRLRWG